VCVYVSQYLATDAKGNPVLHVDVLKFLHKGMYVRVCVCVCVCVYMYVCACVCVCALS